MPDLVDICTDILIDGLGGYPVTDGGQPIVPPRYAVRCSQCAARVEARPRAVSPSRVAYVLPIDREGRCSACVLTLCEFCDGKPGGCKRCNWTGQAQR